MRNSKNSQRIVVREVEYRWRATGNDSYISVTIWPTNNIGPSIHGNIDYHETWIDRGNGIRHSAGDQIVVTNRLILRILEYAILEHQYDPMAKAKQLNLYRLEDKIKWDDAVRGSLSSQDSE